MRFICGVVTCGILVAVLAAPALAGPIENLLPRDTVLLVSVEDVPASRARLTASPLHELWMEADVQSFLAKPLEKLNEALAKKEAELGGAGIFDLLGWIDGQLALAVTGTREVSKGTHYLGAVVLMEIGSNEAKVRDWLKKVEPAAFKPEEVRRVEEEFRGAAIVSYLPRAEDEDPAAEGRGVSAGPPCWFIHDGLFAFGDDLEVLKAILVRRGGDGEESLLTSPRYKTVFDRCAGAGDLFVFVNLESIWETVESVGKGDEGDETETAGRTKHILTALGLKEPRAVGLSLRFTDQGMVQQAFLETPTPRTGIMQLLDGGNSGLMPPSFVPPGVSTAMTVTIDFQAIWKEARRIMDQIEPGTTEMLDEQLAEIKEQAGLDIEKDFIGSLAKSITFYQFEPEAADPEDPRSTPELRMVLGIELSNPAQAEQALGVMAQMVGGMDPKPVEETYLGVKIHVLDFGVMQTAVGIAADHLLIATQADDLRAIIRTLGKDDVASLSSSDDFRRAMADLSRVRSGVFFSDPRKSFDTLSEQIGAIGSRVAPISEWLDLSLFPGELLKKYFDVAGSVLVNDDDGISLFWNSRLNRPNKTDNSKPK